MIYVTLLHVINTGMYWQIHMMLLKTIFKVSP